MYAKSPMRNGDLKDEDCVEKSTYSKILAQRSMVCRLHKALYGLKKTPKTWYDKINDFFLPSVAALLHVITTSITRWFAMHAHIIC